MKKILYIFFFNFILLCMQGISASERLYVVQSLDESLGQVDLVTGTVDNHVLSLCYLPNDLIIHEDKLYVVNTGCNTLQEIDIESNSTLREISLTGGANPWSVAALNHDTLAVSCSQSNNIILISLASGSVVGSIPVGLGPQGMLVHDSLFYICLTRLNWPAYGQGVVMVYNRKTLQLSDSIVVGTNPQTLAMDNFGRLHIVCTGNYAEIAGSIYVVNPSNLSQSTILPVGGTPATISFGGEYAFVAAGGWQGAGFVHRYRLSDLDVLNDSRNPIQTGEGAFDVEAEESGSFFVSCFSENSVQHFSADGELIQNYEISVGPGFMVLYKENNSSASGHELLSNIPEGITILSAYPNPFNGTVQLSVQNSSSQDFIINIYNMLGQKVDHIFVQARNTEVLWNPLNLHGTSLSSGTYMAVTNNQNCASIIKLNFVK